MSRRVLMSATPSTLQECKLPVNAICVGDRGDHVDREVAQQCRHCGLRCDCLQHPCKCSKCQVKGTAKVKCRWRVTTTQFLKRRAALSRCVFMMIE